MTQTVPVNVTWLLVLVGLALPVLVDVVTPTRAGRAVRLLVLLGMSVVAVLSIDLIGRDGDSVAEVVGDSVLLFLLAIGLTELVWRPFGVTGRNGTIVKRRNGGDPPE
jgi:hypothetical protein